MILFLASETMFFVGLIGSFIVLRGGNADLFAMMSAVPSRPAAASEVTILFAGLLPFFLALKFGRTWLWGAVICGLIFLAMLSTEYQGLLRHETIVGRELGKSPIAVFDGNRTAEDDATITLTGFTAPAEVGLDIHQVAPGWPGASPGTFQIEKASISGRIPYSISKNVFFASFWTLTAVHAMHVIGGIIAILIVLLWRTDQRVIAHLAIYWFFVAAVGLFLYPLLHFP
jgi:heme/copper-type cytochrome/quinol oxidase subunit 3